jgi:uncharacterized protein (TIGR03435 family)
MRRLLLCSVTLMAAVLARGEALPSFEAATVKPNLAGVGGNNIGASAETLTMSNGTLSICLKFAYDVQDSQILGPESLNTERYDIVGKAAGPVSDQRQFKLMMQSLLAERFHLVVHRENKETSVYALVVAKSGPKFQKSVGEGRPMMLGKGTLVAQFATMKMLADFLSGPMRVRVLDMTGLEGPYHFKFDLMAFTPTDLAPGQEPDVAGMVLSGLEPQLGLKLESRKAPVEMLVVDHVEKPSEN